MPQFPQMDDAFSKLFRGAHSVPTSATLSSPGVGKEGTDALTASSLQRPLLSPEKRTQVSCSPAAPVTGGQEPRVPLWSLALPRVDSSWRNLGMWKARGGGGWLYLCRERCGLGEGSGCFGSPCSGVLSGWRKGWLQGNGGWTVPCSAWGAKGPGAGLSGRSSPQDVSSLRSGGQ